MKTITKNEMVAVLVLFKDISTDYNANNLSKKIGITPMGTLKILKSLEKQNILKSKQMGKAVFYKPALENNYARTYVKFILQKEAEQKTPKIKRWVKELRQFQSCAEIGILFGSLLRDGKFNDVDLLLVFEQTRSARIGRLLNNINKVNIKKIHMVKQTKKDLEKNLGKGDRTVLSMIKNGIVLFGYDEMIEVIENATRQKQG